MEAELQILAALSWLVLLKFLQVSLYPALKGPLGKSVYPVSWTGNSTTWSSTG